MAPVLYLAVLGAAAVAVSACALHYAIRRHRYSAFWHFPQPKSDPKRMFDKISCE